MKEVLGSGSGEPGNEGAPNVEREKKIDYERYQRSLNDGTADQYIEEVEALPVEALLEEQGDNRVWSELSGEEQATIGAMLEEYARTKGYTTVHDEEIFVVIPKR